jgi:multidrug resistance efflux pump
MTLATAKWQAADRKLAQLKARGAPLAELDHAVDNEEFLRSQKTYAELRMHATSIESPMEGTVLEFFKTDGDEVEPGAQIAAVADLSKWVIETEVSEENLGRIWSGQRADVTVPALSRGFTGTVSEVSRVVDRIKGTAAVKIGLDTTDDALRPGMGAEVTFRPTTR